MSYRKNIILAKIDGRQLLDALSTATLCLEYYSNHINALNVFPVPDGDTGTNMLLTMQSVIKETKGNKNSDLSAMSQEISRAALLGARGNSGVILSQFFSGMAKEFQDHPYCNAALLAKALQSGSNAAYYAVSKPVEGTMLTVLRDLSTKALDQAINSANIMDVLESSLLEAHQSLERTPDLLPILKEAGVVDSGGQGLVVMLEGLACHFKGNDPNKLRINMASSAEIEIDGFPKVDPTFLSANNKSTYGYCTQFIIQGQLMDLKQVRFTAEAFGDSVTVIGDESIIKVHLHTLEPRRILDSCSRFGETQQFHVDDMDSQHNQFKSRGLRDQEPPMLGLLAVCVGSGFTDVLKDLGCHSVINCGDTMNPSAEEIISGVEKIGAKRVAVLPNNPDVIPVVLQAASMTKVELICIPTKSIPQGISALLGYSPEIAVEDALSSMNENINKVTTMEIIRAARNTRIDSTYIEQGQIIGRIERSMIITGHTTLEVLNKGILKCELPPGSLVTLYWGQMTNEDEAQETSETLQRIYPNLDLELVYGGQSRYDYIVSLE